MTSPTCAGPVAVSVVGSTGSIGTQTLDVVRRDPSRYEVVALGAQRSVDRLAEQSREFRGAHEGSRFRRGCSCSEPFGNHVRELLQLRLVEQYPCGTHCASPLSAPAV